MIGRVIGRFVLAVFYYVVFTPIALVRRAVAGNPMRHRVGDMGYWLPHHPADSSPEDMKTPS